MCKELERNFVPGRIKKATKKGTQIRYVCVYDKKINELDVLNNYILDYNKKYNANIPIIK